MSLNVTVAGSATLGENSVAFEVSAGTENLPPTVEIDLESDPESDPEGITFGSSSACTGTSPTTVVCATGFPAIELLSAPFLRALVSTEGVPTVVTAPLVIPQEQDRTDLTFTLRLPDGYADPDMTDNVAHASYVPVTTPPPSGIELSIEAPESIRTTEPRTYTLPVTITATPPLPPDYSGNFAFTLASRPTEVRPTDDALLIESSACVVAPDGREVLCTLDITAQNNDRDVEVDLTLTPVRDVGDTETGNTKPVKLVAFRGTDQAKVPTASAPTAPSEAIALLASATSDVQAAGTGGKAASPAPSATSSPVVETIEEAAQTFTKVARSVTLAEKRPTMDRTSSITSGVTKSAKTVKDTAVREVTRKPSESKATRTDRRDAVRDERHGRAATKAKRSSAGDGPSQKQFPDATSPTSRTTFEGPATGVVDTVVTAVKNVL